MPPIPLEWQGRDLADRFLTATAVLHPRCNLVATRANAKSAFGVYARHSWAAILPARDARDQAQ
jgi:hypothetical protein